MEVKGRSCQVAMKDAIARYRCNFGQYRVYTIENNLNVICYFMAFPGVGLRTRNASHLLTYNHVRVCLKPEAMQRKTYAQTPLIRFVVDLLYNKLYNKSTTNRSPTTNRQHLDMSRCCEFVVQQIRVHNKSTTNRSNGVWILRSEEMQRLTV